ncbi:MAG: rod shape-determining protein MreC [Iamia sp.]
MLILASLTILTLDYRDTGPVQGVRGVAGTVFSPFRSVGDAVATPFRNGWNGIFGYDDLKDENDELRAQIEEMKGQEVVDANAAAENDELRRMLDLPVTDAIQRVVAEVVAAPLSNFDATLEINRGAGDGIKERMAVVTDAGFVGRVVQVEGGRSRIQLITDPDFPGVGVRLVDAGDASIAVPGTGGNVDVEGGIELDTDMERGDEMVTSGSRDDNYPPGIPVGSVLSVGRTSDRAEQTAIIEPTASLEGLKFVAVLLCDADCT